MTARTSSRLRLRVSAGSRRSEIVGRQGDAWKVRVQAAPERGRANAAVLELLAERLAVPASELALVSGATSREKVVELKSLSAAEASERLEGRA